MGGLWEGYRRVLGDFQLFGIFKFFIQFVEEKIGSKINILVTQTISIVNKRLMALIFFLLPSAQFMQVHMSMILSCNHDVMHWKLAWSLKYMKEGKEMHVSFVICEALIVILISIILSMMLFYILILCISKSLGVWWFVFAEVMIAVSLQFCLYWWSWFEDTVFDCSCSAVPCSCWGLPIIPVIMLAWSLIYQPQIHLDLIHKHISEKW